MILDLERILFSVNCDIINVLIVLLLWFPSLWYLVTVIHFQYNNSDILHLFVWIDIYIFWGWVQLLLKQRRQTWGWPRWSSTFWSWLNTTISSYDRLRVFCAALYNPNVMTTNYKRPNRVVKTDFSWASLERGISQYLSVERIYFLSRLVWYIFNWFSKSTFYLLLLSLNENR